MEKRCRVKLDALFVYSAGVTVLLFIDFSDQNERILLFEKEVDERVSYLLSWSLIWN